MNATPTPQSWHKSSYSQPTSGNCVEVALLHGATAVRDSQHPDEGHLTISTSEWTAFVAAAKSRNL